MPPVEIIFGSIVIAAPAALLVGLGVWSLVGRGLGERPTRIATLVTAAIGFLAAASMLGWMLTTDVRHVPLVIGNWVDVADYHFTVQFAFDRLSIPFALLTFLLCGTIGLFAGKYLHREPGYNRFFVLYAFFQFGMIVACLAGSIETLFVGWELVGLSSAFQVGFFHERPAPVRNGLRVWCVYRVSDAALLAAAVVMHHVAGTGDFQKMFGTGPWPDESSPLVGNSALLIGTLLVIAAAGKSALVPFSGWLPRAMEGPTPSSAIFYGALSVHLGVFLLLRASPVYEASPWLSGAIIALGLLTALYASLVGSVQTDIKSVLSFASLTQVGLIVAEIGAGWSYLALAHLVGHACLRTLQFLRAPTLLQDYRHLENALGTRLPGGVVGWSRLVPASMRGWLYRFALERGYLDATLNEYVARPVIALFTGLDRIERRWAAWIGGPPDPTPSNQPEWAE